MRQVGWLPARRFCFGRAPAPERHSSPGSTMSGCIRTRARPGTKKTTCSSAKACARWRSCRPLGWVGPDVWYAHGIHFNTEELKLLAETGTGVCHCPISNTKLASGIARIPEMLKLGVPVGLGVDGPHPTTARA